MNNDGEKKEKTFLNCYDSNGICLFSTTVRSGVEPGELGNFISNSNELIDSWGISKKPEGTVVKY